jgi:LmbE family N-acetylglucosaminyl deacetylase
MDACKHLGGTFHCSITCDMKIFYDDRFIRKLTAIVREVQPDIILTHSLDDYMYDHINTAKLIISAAFARGAPNYVSIPNRKAIAKNVAIYHALPYGCRNMMRQNIIPDFYIDIGQVINEKKNLLSKHQSQREWLQATQGIDSYINEMENMCRTVGTLSKKFELAEAFSLHLHLGYATKDYNPLIELLADVSS